MIIIKVAALMKVKLSNRAQNIITHFVGGFFFFSFSFSVGFFVVMCDKETKKEREEEVTESERKKNQDFFFQMKQNMSEEVYFVVVLFLAIREWNIDGETKCCLFVFFFIYNNKDTHIQSIIII